MFRLDKGYQQYGPRYEDHLTLFQPTLSLDQLTGLPSDPQAVAQYVLASTLLAEGSTDYAMWHQA